MPPPQPDFRKRIKAKVGKRARKPENVTDANFRAASLKLATQSALQQETAASDPSKNDNSSSSSLISSRGKHLQELITQIQHPAGAVRVAAMKGLLDILMQQQPNASSSSFSPIQQHLSVWIAVASKSVVDTEPDVRSTGLALWQELFQKTTAVATPALWQPFAPLLAAYVSTALNSLDQQTRLHGASVVWLFASNLPSLMAPATSILLPAFARLLPEEQVNTTAAAAGTSSAGRSSKQQRARKKHKTSTTTTIATDAAETKTSSTTTETNSPVLQALVALLQTTTMATTTTGSSFVNQDNDNSYGGTVVRIVKHSTGKQALILTSNRRSRRVPTALFNNTDNSALDLATALSSNDPGIRNDAQHLQQAIGNATPIMTSQELLSKLCDRFVELVQPNQQLQQQQQPQQAASGGSSSDTDWNRLLLVTRAIRLLWDHHISIDSIARTSNKPSSLSSSSSSSSPTTRKPSFSKQCQQLASLLLEQFPFLDARTNSNNNNTTIDKEINAEICQTLLLMSRKLPDKNAISIKTVIKYVQSEFQQVTTQRNSSSIRPPNDNLSKPLLAVMGELLLNRQIILGVYVSRGDDDDSSKSSSSNDKTAMKLTSLFCAYFFPDQVEAGLARSQVGRSAARLVVALMKQHDCSLQAVRQELGVDLVKVMDRILQYVVHWNADYPHDTKAIVELLLHTVQRLCLNVGKSADNVFFQHLKSGLEPLFVSCQGERELVEPSVFERFPPELQRMVISLVTLLEAPTEKMVKALGRICARCRLKVDDEVVPSMEASFIVSSVHSMRKTMKMQVYLSFLIDATGIMAVDFSLLKNEDEETETTASYRKALALDEAIADSCLCLIECRPCKVVPMLEPLLSKLLSHEGKKPSLHEAVRMRAVLALLDMFSMDIKSIQPDGSVLNILSADLHEKVIQGASILFQTAAELSENSISQVFLRPINALLASEEVIASRLEEKSSSKS